MSGRVIRKILVVDSNGASTPHARLPRVLKALGSYRERADACESVKRDSDGAFHDLSGYDLVLVHERDAKLDNGAFHQQCFDATVPCVVYSGGVYRNRKQSDRLLELSDAKVLAYAADGVLFLEETGRLDLTAWTQGLEAARRAEIVTLCNAIHRAVLAGSGRKIETALVELVRAVRVTSRYQTVAVELEQFLSEAQGSPDPSFRERLFRVLDELVANV